MPRTRARRRVVERMLIVFRLLFVVEASLLLLTSMERQWYPGCSDEQLPLLPALC